MRVMAISLLLAGSLSAFQGEIRLGHLGPVQPAMMLERRLLAVNFKQVSLGSGEIQLEQRTFEKLYTESRLSLLPSLFWGDFQAGLGLHYRAINLPQLDIEQQQWLPAAAATWQSDALLLRARYSSMEFWEGEVAILQQLLWPLEFSLWHRQDNGYFDGTRFSLLAYLHPTAGAGVRYYVSSETTSLMGWLRPITDLAIRLEYHLPSRLRPFTALEFSLEYRFGSSLQRSQRLPQRSAAVLEDAPEATMARPRKIPAPPYAVLVRKGVDPMEALAIAKTGDLCQASASVKSLLQVPAGSCAP